MQFPLGASIGPKVQRYDEKKLLQNVVSGVSVYLPSEGTAFEFPWLPYWGLGKKHEQFKLVYDRYIIFVK